MTTSSLLFATLRFCEYFPTKRDMESGAQRELKQRLFLKQLIEIYALEVSRLSEAIAVLGEHVSAQRPIDKSIIEIKNLSRLVERARVDLFAFVGQSPE
jgi:hypothetical protein